MDKNNKNTKPLELKVKILGKKKKKKKQSFVWVNSMKTFLKLYHPISR